MSGFDVAARRARPLRSAANSPAQQASAVEPSKASKVMVNPAKKAIKLCCQPENGVEALPIVLSACQPR
jgi:hypothetical protein